MKAMLLELAAAGHQVPRSACDPAGPGGMDVSSDSQCTLA